MLLPTREKIIKTKEKEIIILHYALQCIRYLITSKNEYSYSNRGDNTVVCLTLGHILKRTVAGTFREAHHLTGVHN